MISHQQATVPGLDQRLDVRDQDPNGLYSHPTLALRAGRYPTSSSEVAITNGVADLLGTHIGDEVDLGGVRRTVVGEVENPRDLDDEFALVAPTTNDGADSLTVLVDTNNPEPSATTDAPAQAQLQLEVFGDETTAVAAFVLVAITIAMALVGLIASAGFVVVAQRRQRQLGLLAAIGATPRHLRLVMLANGAIVGVIAAVIGAGVGRRRLDRRRAGGRDCRRPSHRPARPAMGPHCAVHGDRRRHGDCGGLVAGADDGPTPRDQRARRAGRPARPPSTGRSCSQAGLSSSA